jgi:hypothetical protein
VAAQGAPLLTRTFPGGSSLLLDIPPGNRVIAMTTFRDANGKIPTGSACEQVNLAGGRGACLSLMLTSVDGGGCSPTSDTCPAGQFCGSDFICRAGCKGSADCTDPTRAKCDPARHQCVACAANSDCKAPQMCSPSGTCTQPCTMSATCGAGESCCGGFCADTLTDPLNCNGCNQPCTGDKTLCCNGVCADPSTDVANCGACNNACSTLNGMAACSIGVCSWTCNSDFQHCAMGNTGCETASNSVDNCGGCGNVCTPTNATANSCSSGTSCSYTCASGFLDCVKVGANTDGCETSGNNVSSCGGCNNVCDTTHSLGATCPAGTCLYTGCMPGFTDCNQGSSNTDGCECTTPMCCGTSCQPIHSNGLNSNTYLLMCQPLGVPGTQSTYTSAMASAAAASWMAGTDGTLTCLGTSCVTRTGTSTCATWCYAKGIAGHVLEAATCTCPNTGSPSWN